MTENERLVLAQESALVLHEYIHDLETLLGGIKSNLAVRMAESYEDAEKLETLVERKNSEIRGLLEMEAKRLGQV
jgi:hypothetical protein